MGDRMQADPPRRDRAVRRMALRGAVLAGAVLIAVAAAHDLLGGWLLGGAVLVLALSAVAVADEPRSRTPPPSRTGTAPPQAGIADAVLAHIPDPVILVDRRSIVIQANDAAEALLPNLKARHPLSFALRSPDVLRGIEEVLASGETRRVEHVERVPTERVFEVQIGLLKVDPAALGGQTGVVLFFRDLTSARRLENMRVDFVANASHELRTPLASLLGFIETLQGPARNDPAARERFLEIMRGQAQRMTRLIDDLLSLSRIEMRAHLPPETVIDLVPVAVHMVDTLSPLIRERGMTVAVTTPPEPLWVLGDRDELLRVTENLIGNAVKYGEGGGRIEVSLARRSGPDGASPEAELCVRDHGPGIAPEHLPRLTERFYRVDVAESRQKGGTGLGLAIVKHIVNRHRGRLVIESEPGQGASFRVVLPRRAGPSGA
jgi:two-component system, OmpR family, phosphate regulon sensor histidine kinase PhoR